MGWTYKRLTSSFTLIHNLAESIWIKSSIGVKREWERDFSICTTFEMSEDKENHLNEKYTAPIWWKHCQPWVKEMNMDFFLRVSMGRK